MYKPIREETERARIELDQLLNETVIGAKTNMGSENIVDVNYEKLYIYRLLEALSLASEKTDNYNTYRNKCFEAFPQLMPFAGFPAKMKISFSGLENDEIVQAVIEDLKDCNIEFTEETNVPKAQVRFEKKGTTYQAILNVWTENDKPIVSEGQLLFKQKDGVGKELALRLFGKGGAAVFVNPIE